MEIQICLKFCWLAPEKATSLQKIPPKEFPKVVLETSGTMANHVSQVNLENSQQNGTNKINVIELQI